jgi:hypothetical protein
MLSSLGRSSITNGRRTEVFGSYFFRLRQHSEKIFGYSIRILIAICIHIIDSTLSSGHRRRSLVNSRLIVNNPMNDWQNEGPGLELGQFSSHRALADCSRMCVQ